MKILKIFSLAVITTTMSVIYACTSFAAEPKPTEDLEDVKTVVQAPSEDCGFSVPDEISYGAQVISIRRKLKVDPEENFRVKVFMKNTGNMPWFSTKSACSGPKMWLGTDRDRDRESILYTPAIEGIQDTNWITSNRIGMDQLKIMPGEIASFTFWATAPKNADMLKEYFTPILKELQWLDESEFSFEIMVGDTGENPHDLRKKLLFANWSGSVTDINLDGEKKILVDLSDQTLQLLLDGQVIRFFQVSTGASDTPTPVGETEVLLKQEIRVGTKPPHYIMPKFMMFRSSGYGIHALPSLGGDGGWFWTEARSHIGIPVSHGCIRLLPEDANFAYEFADIGTPVIVQW